jgi:tetratricopeptide (TPR) repeat protein
MKTGRNDPCPCGSGQKFKKCCASKALPPTTGAPQPAPVVTSPLQQAVAHHQAGRLSEAEALYRSLLKKDPRNADALHLLGMVTHQSGNQAEAERLIRKAIAVDNKAAFFHLNLGNVLKEQGKREEAIGSFRKAISLQPGMAEAHYNLANELYANNEPESAVAHYTKAVQADPHLADAHYNLGIALQRLERTQDALSSYSRAIEIQPDHHNAHYNLGLLYQELNRFDEAVTHYTHALKSDPNNADAHYFLGNAYLELEQYDAAEASFRSAIATRPDLAAAYNDLSVTLRKQGRTEDALASARRSLEIAPGFAACNNLGIAHREDGRLEDAIENAEKALALKPDSSEVHWNLALALLQLGRFAPGWQKYEWRAFKKDADLRSMPYPRWDGGSLKDRILFIFSEQGVGDQIMFASLFPDIMKYEPKQCIVDCDRRLVPLFARSFPGLTVIPADKQALPEGSPVIDASIPMGSLPMHLRPELKSFPQQGSFLIADAEKTGQWRSRFKALGTGLKIGISWRGGKDASVRNLRSTTLSPWAGLFQLPGVHFINLQYGDCTQELQNVKQDLGVTIHDWKDADPLNDLDGFAAQIAALDLVISVDNSTVHMAGALGVPTWALLPKACDWRWMGGFEDSPWYSSIRLFRQHVHREWGDVFDAVFEMLGALAPGVVSQESSTCFLRPVKRSYLSAKDIHENITVERTIGNPINNYPEKIQRRKFENYNQTGEPERGVHAFFIPEQGLIDRPIFILGVPRSGTSMVAGLLNVCGAWAGKTVPGGAVNPRGFFEHIILREKVNKKILSSLNCDPLGVKKLPALDLLPGIPDLSGIVKQVIRSEGCPEDRPWLFKDAKLSLIWPIYKSAFPSARWIIVRRKNEDIVRSCLKTNFMVQHSTDPLFWSRWIDAYLDRLDTLKKTGVWWREIWPHDVVSGNLGVLHQLIDELGLIWEENNIRDFILPGSWHASKK